MRKIIALIGVVLCIPFCRAEWLYWQVDFSGSIPEPIASSGDVGLYATLWATDGTGSERYLVSASSAESEAFPILIDETGSGGKTGTLSVDFTQAALSGLTVSELSYFVELASMMDESRLWTSEIATYQTLAADGHILSEIKVDYNTPWTPTMWTSTVPEPTSGVLMLVGMGLLALRRKRA